MKTRLLRCFLLLGACLLMVSAFGQASSVQIPLGLWCTGNNANNRDVLVTPLSLSPPAGVVAVYDRQKFTSDANGNVWAANMYAGTYVGEIQAPPTRTVFWFYVDATNATQNAAYRLLSSTNSAGVPGAWAWSAAISDARYCLSTNGVSPISIKATNHPSAGAYLRVDGSGTNFYFSPN